MRIGTRLLKTGLSSSLVIGLTTLVLAWLSTQNAWVIHVTKDTALHLFMGSIWIVRQEYNQSWGLYMSPIPMDAVELYSLNPVQWWFRFSKGPFESWFLVPLWIPAVLSLLVGSTAFVTLRCRARALKNGACPKCGYVLTGLSPAAPCPECGRASSAPR